MQPHTHPLHWYTAPAPQYMHPRLTHAAPAPQDAHPPAWHAAPPGSDTRTVIADACTALAYTHPQKFLRAILGCATADIPGRLRLEWINDAFIEPIGPF